MSKKNKDLFAGFLTITEAALLLNVNRRSIYNYLRTGKIEAVRMMGRQYIRLSSILANFPQEARNA